MSKAIRTAPVAASPTVCGSEGSGPLSPGSRAVLGGPEGTPLDVIVFDYPQDGGEPTHRTLAVPAGTHVVVLDDAEDDSSRPERRMVQVRIVEGPHRRAAAYVSRF